MRRIAAAASPLALLAALVFALVIFVGDSSAELENQVFTSRTAGLRLIAPRGWRATDQPSYPGLILWMVRGQPQGQIVLTAEPFTRELYCTWPLACRASHDALPSKFACALRDKLQSQRLRVGPVQAGPKDNEAVGLPSVWFEYDDGSGHFLRQAVALSADHAISLVLSAPTNEARAVHVRAFEQALRTLRPLTAEEAVPIGGGKDGSVATAVPADGAAPASAVNDGGPPDAAASFESAPAAKINPIGACP